MKSLEEMGEDKTREFGMTADFEDMEDLELRVYDEDMSTSLEHDGVEHSPVENPDYFTRGKTPHEQDLAKYPELFHQYQENYSAFEQANRKFDQEIAGTQATAEPHDADLPYPKERYHKKYDVDAPRFTGTFYQ